MDIREYAQAFDQVERDYEDAVAAFGIPFEVAESCPRERRSQTAAMCGCHFENGGGSLMARGGFRRRAWRAARASARPLFRCFAAAAGDIAISASPESGALRVLLVAPSGYCGRA